MLQAEHEGYLYLLKERKVSAHELFELVNKLTEGV